MKKSSLAKYKRKVHEDLAKVDDAINNGANLSRKEWFDFCFKSELVDYRCKNKKRYYSFNKQVCLLSSVMADVFTYVTSIAIDGFDNNSYKKGVKKLVRDMNRFAKNNIPTEISGYDRNGALFIRILSGRNNVETCTVKGQRDAINTIFTLVGYCIENADTFLHDGDFGKFLDGYLSQEFSLLVGNIEPTPYVSEKYCDTLSEHLEYINNSDKKVYGKIITIS